LTTSGASTVSTASAGGSAAPSSSTPTACGLVGPEPLVALVLARLARSRRRDGAVGGLARRS
jgi:hypothetical protein